MCPSSTFSINTGVPATWSVTSGFSLSTNSGASTIVTAAVSNIQSGTLTAVVNGTTLTQSINACPLILGPDYVSCNGSFTYNLTRGQAISWAVDPSSVFSITSSTSTSVSVTTSGPHGTPGVVVAIFGSAGWFSKLISASCPPKSGSNSDFDAYVTVYPNPTSGLLNVEIDVAAYTMDLQSKNSAPATKYNVRLYDGQGNLQCQESTMDGRVQFDVSNLNIGIYFLLIDDGVSNPVIRQVAVQH